MQFLSQYTGHLVTPRHSLDEGAKLVVVGGEDEQSRNHCAHWFSVATPVGAQAANTTLPRASSALAPHPGSWRLCSAVALPATPGGEAVSFPLLQPLPPSPVVRSGVSAESCFSSTPWVPRLMQALWSSFQSLSTQRPDGSLA